MNRAFSKILVLVILIALTGGGFFAWQYFGRMKGEVRAPKEKALEEETIKDKTANWKTYRDDDFGFEIKYPPNWEFSREIQPFFTPPNSGGIIKFKPVGKTYTLPSGEISYVPVKIEVYNFSFPDPELLNDIKTTHKEILINGFEFIKFESHPGKPAQEFLVESPKRGYAFINNLIPVIVEMKAGITTKEKNSYQAIFDQMISSFKFLE